MYLDLPDIVNVARTSKHPFLINESDIIKDIVLSRKTCMFDVLEYAIVNRNWGIVLWMERRDYWIFTSDPKSSMDRCYMIELARSVLDVGLRDAMETIGICETTQNMIRYYMKDIPEHISMIVSMGTIDIIDAAILTDEHTDIEDALTSMVSRPFGVGYRRLVLLLAHTINFGDVRLADLCLSILDKESAEKMCREIVQMDVDDANGRCALYCMKYLSSSIRTHTILNKLAKGNNDLFKPFISDIVLPDVNSNEFREVVSMVICNGQIDVLDIVLGPGTPEVISVFTDRVLLRGVTSLQELEWVVRRLNICPLRIFDSVHDEITSKSVLEWVSIHKKFMYRVNDMFQRALRGSWLDQIELAVRTFGEHIYKNVCVGKYALHIIEFLVSNGFNVSFSSSMNVGQVTIDDISRLSSMGINICEACNNVIRAITLSEETPHTYLNAIGLSDHDILHETVTALASISDYKKLMRIYKRRLTESDAIHILSSSTSPERYTHTVVYAVIAGGMGHTLLGTTMSADIRKVICDVIDNAPSSVKVAALDCGILDSVADSVNISVLIALYNVGVSRRRILTISKKMDLRRIGYKCILRDIPIGLMTIIWRSPIKDYERSAIFRGIEEYMDGISDRRFADIIRSA